MRTGTLGILLIASALVLSVGLSWFTVTPAPDRDEETRTIPDTSAGTENGGETGTGGGEPREDPFPQDRGTVPVTLPPAEHPFSYRHLTREDVRSQRASADAAQALLERRIEFLSEGATTPWTLPPAKEPGQPAGPLAVLFEPRDFVDVEALRIADPSGTHGNNNDDSPPDWDVEQRTRSTKGPGLRSEMPTPFKGKAYEKLAYHLCPPAAVGDFRNFQWDVFDPIVRDQGRFDPIAGTFVFLPDGESDSLSYFGEPQFPGADNPDGLVFFLRWRDADCDGTPNHFDLRWPFAEFWGDRGNGKVTFAYQFPFEDFFENKDDDLLRDQSVFQMQIGFWEDGEPLFYPPFQAPDTDARPELVNLQSNFEEKYDDRNGDGVIAANADRYARYWDVALELDGALGTNNGITEGAFYDIYTTEFDMGATVEDWRVVLFLDHEDDGHGPLANVLASMNQVDEHYWLDNFGGVLFHAPPEDFTTGFAREPNFRKLPYHLGVRMDSLGPKEKDFSGIPPPPTSPIPTPPVTLDTGLGACGGGAVDRGFPAKYAEGVYQGLYLLLTEILDHGLAVPPQLVPYWIYTLSDGVEKFCQAITNVAATLNLDDDDATGKGLLGDMRLNSHLSLGPLAAVSKADLLGDVNPASLHLNVTFPAFFFNGEAHDVDGEPHWKLGYTTQAGEPIPRDVRMTLAVDHTVGAEHVFDFDWDSINGIPPLGFHFGVFQVVDQDLSDPRLPATGTFTVSSPPFAFLTFSTFNTATTTTNCMNWSAPATFNLGFGFNGNRTLFGVPVLYQINITVQSVQTAWSFCMTQDRAANTDTLTYVANGPVALVLLDMDLNITGITNLTVEIQIQQLTTGFSATLGDGFLDFTVSPAGQKIGALILNITEMTGFLNLLNAFVDETIVYYHLILEGIPSFLATWETRSAAPPWNSFGVVTDPGMDLDALTAAISTVPAAFVFFASAETQRAMLYHNNSVDLGTGTTDYEATLWVHFEDLTRLQVGWGGASPTIAVGISTSTPHALRIRAELGNASALNPIDPPGPVADTNLTADVTTTDLPASMDFNITTATNFTYAASDGIDLITASLRTDEARVDFEIEGIPATVEGRWRIDEDGFVRIELGDRLTRIEGVVENALRLFDTDYVHVEVLILDVPEGLNATWDMGNTTALVSFLDGDYDEGLGDVRFLGTEGLEANTTAYLTGLGAGSACMLEYSAFTQAIDGDYWPATVPGRLDALHCRHPTLDSVADDFAVQGDVENSTDDFEVLTFRARELGFLEVNWSGEGFAELQFSRNVDLERQFYYADDDFGSDSIMIVEASRLPDGEATNGVRAEWDLLLDPGDRFHAEYTLTEVIPFIDYYDGVHNFLNESATMRKIVLQDIPASVVLEWIFGDRQGSFDFTASNLWEMGILDQAGGTRYGGWLAMQSAHFDYDFALPGEEDCEYPGDFDLVEFCYRVFRLDSTLDAVDSVMDGILGIYSLEESLDALDSGETPDTNEFIPEWAFMVDDFDVLEVHVLWDVGAAVGLFLPVGIDFSLFPTVNVVLEVGTIIVDYFWNDKVDETLIPDPGIPGPGPGAGCGMWAVTIEINFVKDYIDQNPIHLFPLAGASLLDDDSDISIIPFGYGGCPPVGLGDNIDIDIRFDVLGFHRFPDHPDLFP